MTELLMALESQAPPTRVVVFSDQLVSAVEAPLRVRHRGQECYLSSIELLASTQFGYDLRVWTGRRAIRVKPTSPSSVLGLLVEYLRVCRLLGADWLAEPVQIQRTTTYRAAEVRRRVRLLQSALLAGMVERSAPMESVRNPIRRLDKLHDAVGRWEAMWPTGC